ILLEGLEDLDVVLGQAAVNLCAELEADSRGASAASAGGDVVPLEKGNLESFFREVIGGGTAMHTAADDGDVNLVHGHAYRPPFAWSSGGNRPPSDRTLTLRLRKVFYTV